MIAKKDQVCFLFVFSIRILDYEYCHYYFSKFTYVYGFFFKFSDPRLRKSKDENRKMKEGSLGELLETDRPKRSVKFKGV